MPTILLIRHGPVAQKASGLLSFEALRRYIEAYELSGLAEGAEPPAELKRLTAQISTVFASDAPRVRDTLRRLDLDADALDPAFREAPPAAPRLPLPLPEIGWLALARARGAFDPALKKERDDLRLRATRYADRLVAASRSGAVALVGHGWFNRHVAQALAERGWRRAGGPGFARPWGYLRLDNASA